MGQAWKQKSDSTNPGSNVIGSDIETTVGGLIGGAIIAGGSMVALTSSATAEKDKKTTSVVGTDLGTNAGSALGTLKESDAMKSFGETTGKRDDDAGSGETLVASSVTVPSQNGSLYDTPSIPSEKERIEAARIAMEEYIERDDGAEDWLRTMNEILEDDEFDEGLDDSTSIGNDASASDGLEDSQQESIDRKSKMDSQ